LPTYGPLANKPQKKRIGAINAKVSKLKKAWKKLESKANSHEGETLENTLKALSQIMTKIQETQSSTFDLNQNVL